MDQVERLKQVTKEVYQQGFNIHMMIQKMNKELKLLRTEEQQQEGPYKNITIPPQVLIKVCETYLRQKEMVRNKFAWFMRTITQVSREYSAQENMRRNAEYKQRDKKGPQLMQDILRRMYEQGK